MRLTQTCIFPQLQASMEPPLMDVHMNISAWPGLIAAVGILITRVSAVEVTSDNICESELPVLQFHLGWV